MDELWLNLGLIVYSVANAKLVYACEWNPNAIEALQHNLQANSVSDRCIVLEGDNQITAPKAWKLWNENRAMELMDALMEKPTPASEVLRCIQVSLLCVQQHPEDRPPIASVLLMLDGENSSLPQPKQPGFYTERSITKTDSSSSGKTPYTYNVTG
ncbi:receptor-like serine/threonine-protein kinase sd1-7 [Quercus suber]|uniref:Receptor-like serine/threonine-protein kinase sd1-7 n=1 Tax=Quercus suber TaxID=58331 RepID=A0AAW0LV56_QUESU